MNEIKCIACVAEFVEHNPPQTYQYMYIYDYASLPRQMEETPFNLNMNHMQQILTATVSVNGSMMCVRHGVEAYRNMPNHIIYETA